MSKKTAEQHRQAAADHQRKAQESFDRCDTDGFLSQWANGKMSALESLKAEIAENGGFGEFTGLWQGDRRVAAKMIDGKFGTSWLLDDAEAARFGRRFIPTGDNSRVQKKLGLSQRREWAPAWAFMNGSGTGLSGNAWAQQFRTGCKWGTDASLEKPEPAPAIAKDGLACMGC